MGGFRDLFPKKPIIGMVHLKPLPGSHRWNGNFTNLIDWALKDASALVEGGVDALIVENMGDAPFRRDRVGSETVATMTRVVTAVKYEFRVTMGTNVLRNDAFAALAIATATNCQFIRVNIWCGEMLTDQGIIRGEADEVLRYRKLLGSEVLVFADVLVKHAVPLGNLTMEQAAEDAWVRGCADALIVSGPATGKSVDPTDIDKARTGASEALILIGSGVTPNNLKDLLVDHRADGAIVGKYFKRDGLLENPVDEGRVATLVKLRDKVVS